MAFFLAACLAGVSGSLRAQDPEPPSDVSPALPSSSFGSSSPGGSTGTPANPTLPSASDLPLPSSGSALSNFGLPASSFGSGPETGTGATPANPSEAPAGATTTPGVPGNTPGFSSTTVPGAPSLGTGSLTGAGTVLPQASPTTFTVPAAYGQVPQTFVVGQGRLARPHFEYSGAVSMGYDDNTFSASFNAVDQKEVRQRVETSPATPAFVEVVPVPVPRGGGANGQRPYKFVYVPAQKAQFEDVVVSPKVPAQRPEGSFALRASAAAEVQFSSRRTVFTLDARGSATDFLDRSQSPLQYDGSISLALLHRITPRLQFSATANLAYLSQPDLTRINAPTNNTGNYFNANSKVDLTYRWSRRFSTVSSLSLNSQLFESKSQQAQNFYEIIFGTEGRWLMTPRLTLVGEGRVSRDIFPNTTAEDSDTVFALVGGELVLTRRMNVSLRVGQELRTFSDTGKVRTSPYLETAVGYAFSQTGLVSWNSRVGFESPSQPNSTDEVLRTGVNVVQAFSTRLRGTLGLSAVHRIVTDNSSGGDTVSDNSVELDVGLAYTLSKHASFTANYTFLGDLSTVKTADYVRNQLFVGVQYAY